MMIDPDEGEITLRVPPASLLAGRAGTARTAARLGRLAMACPDTK